MSFWPKTKILKLKGKFLDEKIPASSCSISSSLFHCCPPLLLHTLPCVVHSNLIWLGTKKLDPKTRGREKDGKTPARRRPERNLTVEPIRKIHSVYACWLFISLCTRRKTSAVRMSYNVLLVLFPIFILRCHFFRRFLFPSDSIDG